MTFQSTPSFLIPYPTSGTLSLASSGTATPFPLSFMCRSTGNGLARPLTDEDEGDREGEGGGNALEGNRAIGRRRLGVEVPLDEVW
jgi:hypothetical protein